MSLDATRWAWAQLGIKAAEKLVLLSLADRADERHRCFPSVERLVSDTCLNRKTIMAAIQSLETSGLISVSRSNGIGNIYHLNGVEERHATSPKNGTTCSKNKESDIGGFNDSTKENTSTESGTGTESGTSTEIGTTPVPKTGLGPVPKTGHKPTNESTNESLNNLFALFWGVYPRKKAKGDAEKAFRAAKPNDDLIAKIKTDISGRLARGEWVDPQYIPYPATYLRDRRWEDEPERKVVAFQKGQGGIARTFENTDYKTGADANGKF